MTKFLKIIFINISVFVSIFLLTIFVATTVFHFYEKQYQIQSLIPYVVHDKWVPNTSSNFVFNGLEKYTLRFSRGGEYQSKHLNDDGSIEYDTTHTISSIGSRVNLFKNINTKKHLLIVGDSQTFGVGVNDDEVYSNILAKKLEGSETQTYNLGFRGWGPATNYLLFDKRLFNIDKYVKEEQGSLVYLFTPELTERDSGTASVFGYLYGTLPYYEEVNGEYIVSGMFEDSFFTAFDRLIASLGHTDKYDKLKREYFPRYLNRVDWENMYEKTAKIFMQMKRDYLLRFPESNFIVLICDYRNESDNLLNKVFDRYDFKYIDYRNEDNCLGNMEFFFQENHLNQNGHQNIADKISRDVLGIKD